MTDPIEAGAPLRTKLANELRAAIGDGRMAPGARLNERQLCEDYGVSRTVVRETLRQLEAEGFIEIQPHKGATVTELSYIRAVDLFDLRASLESLACQLCAQRASIEQKVELSNAVTAVEQAMQGTDMPGLLVAKNRFYAAILAGAANPELTGMVQLLHARIDLLRRYSLTADGRLPASLAEIKAISAAIVAGDIEGARRAGHHHVFQARGAALPRVFQQQYLDGRAEHLDRPAKPTIPK